jgi:hypothetical protein
MPQALTIIAPVQWGGFTRWIGHGKLQHAPGNFRTQRRNAGGSSPVAEQALKSFLQEAFLPAPDARLGLSHLTYGLVGFETFSRKQDDPGRHACFCGALRSFKIAFTRLRSGGLTLMIIPVRMRQPRMPASAGGIPYGIQMSDAIH